MVLMEMVTSCSPTNPWLQRGWLHPPGHCGILGGRYLALHRAALALLAHHLPRTHGSLGELVREGVAW